MKDINTTTLQRIDFYLNKLFPLCRSITGRYNRQTLHVLRELIDLKIYEIKTGERVYDWKIPNEWWINDGWIKNIKGEKIVDFKKNNLHVVGYSNPIECKMYWKELKKHIYIHPDLPNAIPYRTSYYKRNWGFSVTHSQYNELEKHDGFLDVFIDSKLFKGSLTYADYVIPGISSKEILITTYICHPSMANDNLSGVILSTMLAKYISQLKNNYWTYRFIFIPETIGAIAYCSRNESKIKEIDIGLAITTVGGKSKIGIKESFYKDHWINMVANDLLNELDIEYIKYPFDIHGSDERQFSSPGFRINMISITKDKYYEYDQYHSSLDNLDYVKAENIEYTLGIYKKLIQKIEKLEIYIKKIPECETMLSRHNLYSNVGGQLLPTSNKYNDTDIILNILFNSDGQKPLIWIAKKLNLELETVKKYNELLVEAGILKRI